MNNIELFVLGIIIVEISYIGLLLRFELHALGRQNDKLNSNIINQLEEHNDNLTSLLSEVTTLVDKLK